eukprot:TRINITY_DN14173_c1_g1_i1.p1 TRINITY_DN14173_c1_g1~~TRINITY_DN14173_c1_g1_i1.p1  ORF type:complete len:240 (-),score=50.42 TRINITY_DN14173_c1_g1_i1:48-767(-)
MGQSLCQEVNVAKAICDFVPVDKSEKLGIKEGKEAIEYGVAGVPVVCEEKVIQVRDYGVVGAPVDSEDKHTYDSFASRIVFLDVDGVLNSKKTRRLRFREDYAVMGLDDAPSPEMVDNLVYIVEQTCAEIVLSSTWRLLQNKCDEIEQVLGARGLKLRGLTPDHKQDGGTGSRVDEIFAWLMDNKLDGDKVEAWVALDDLDLRGMDDRLQAANFVRTMDSVGLTRKHAEEAVRKLLAQC